MGLTIRDHLAALALGYMRSAITDDDEGGHKTVFNSAFWSGDIAYDGWRLPPDVNVGTRQLALAMLPQNAWQCVALKRRAAVRRQLAELSELLKRLQDERPAADDDFFLSLKERSTSSCGIAPSPSTPAKFL